MTLGKIRRRAEQRLMMFPGSAMETDPAAIPPPGMYQTMNRAGVAVNQHTALQIDVVYTAMRVLRNAIIKMGDPRGYRWAIDDHNRMYKQWMNPQPNFLTDTFAPGVFQYDGRTKIVLSMGLFGESWWYTLDRDYYGFPTAIEVLHPLFVTTKKDEKGKVHYYYGTGSDKIELDPINLTHVPFMAMPGASRGLSSLEFGGINYALALAAMEYGQRWFSQGASPSYLLSTDLKLGDDETKRIAEMFMVEHSGLANAHIPLVLDGGLKAQKISATPDEAQYLNTLGYVRTSIAAWFGLPAHLVGGDADKGNVWGKTVQEQGYQMVDFTLSGYVVPMQEALGSLLPRGQFADFDESAILRANFADLAAFVTAVRSSGSATVNDVRTGYLDLPPVPGGDDINQPLASNQSPTAPAAGATDDSADAGGQGDE